MMHNFLKLNLRLEWCFTIQPTYLPNAFVDAGHFEFMLSQPDQMMRDVIYTMYLFVAYILILFHW